MKYHYLGAISDLIEQAKRFYNNTNQWNENSWIDGKSVNDLISDELKRQDDRIDHLELSVLKLFECVEFYANKENWTRRDSIFWECIDRADCADYPHLTRDVKLTGGKLARKVVQDFIDSAMNDPDISASTEKFPYKFVEKQRRLIGHLNDKLKTLKEEDDLCIDMLIQEKEDIVVELNKKHQEEIKELKEKFEEKLALLNEEHQKMLKEKK